MNSLKKSISSDLLLANYYHVFVRFGFLIMLFFSCLSIHMYAQEYTITTKAGKLSSNLKGKERVKRLTVIGKMNGTDFRYINSLDNLENLDLKNVKIVRGGKPYFDVKGKKYKIKKDNVFDFLYFYSNSSNLKEVVLPNNLIKITNTENLQLGTKFIVYFTNPYPPMLDTDIVLDDLSIIYVPEESYYRYTKAFNMIPIHKIHKDNALDTYNIDLNHQKLNEVLEGGYEYVKKLTINGPVDSINFLILSKLENLEYVDFTNAIIKEEDRVFKWTYILQELLVTDKSREMKEYEKQRDYLREKSKILNIEKDSLGERITIFEKRLFEMQLLKALLGMGDVVLDTEYKNWERTTRSYVSQKIFNNMLDGAVTENLKKIDPKNLDDWKLLLSKIEQEIFQTDSSILEIKKKIEPLQMKRTKEKQRVVDELRNNSYINSIIFRDLNKLNKLETVILPSNTIAILLDTYNDYNRNFVLKINDEVIEKSVYFVERTTKLGKVLIKKSLLSDKN